VGRDGQVRVTDFGLVGMARGSVERAPEDQPLGRASPLDQPLTRTGALLGTPLYMAPEQHLLLPVTAQVDQFAFCVALHEALYGVPPFRGATVRELRDSVLSGVPVRPAAPAHDVPPWLRSIVLRGLALSPGERWPDMDGLLDALTRDPSARRRWWVGAGAGLAGALAHAFAATGRPYAADTFGRVAGALDGYARSWIAMRTAACEATAVRHEQSPALLDRRMQCLDRRLVELGALSALFRGSDPIVVDRAVSATLGLVPLAACADADGLLAQVPLPADPPGRAEATALRGELARATALTRAGKPKEALAAVAPLVPRSRALGYAPVLAEVLLQLGITQRDVGDPRVAEATVIEAARTGAEAKDDTLVAKALIEQMWIVGYRGGRRAEALALTPYIEAAVTRAGGDPIVLGGMYRYEAILLNAEARFGEALAVAERALALYQRANPDGREVANALITMGNIHSDRDDLAQARAAYERAHAIYALLYGPNHPDVATAQTNLANVLFKQGKLAAALETYRATLVISDRVNGPDSQRSGMLLSNVGMVLDGLEQWDEAHAVNLRALAVYEKNLGPDHPDLVQPLSNLGDEMMAQQRWDQAETYYARALAVREKALGKDNLRTAYALEMMTRLRLAQHRSGEALAMARRVLAIREHAMAPGHQQIGEALMLVAEAEAGLSHVTDGLAAAERGVAMMAASQDKLAPAELGDAWLTLARIARRAGLRARAQRAAAEAGQAYDRVEPEAKRARKRKELAAWATPHRP
ncbi:MAG: tetratricopeptide repeat protein, partial [Deltaproteobacteria bacterium]